MWAERRYLISQILVEIAGFWTSYCIFIFGQQCWILDTSRPLFNARSQIGYSSLLNNSTALIIVPRGKFCKNLIVAHVIRVRSAWQNLKRQLRVMNAVSCSADKLIVAHVVRAGVRLVIGKNLKNLTIAL